MRCGVPTRPDGVGHRCAEQECKYSRCPERVCGSALCSEQPLDPNGFTILPVKSSVRQVHLTLLAALVIACRDDRPHVFQAPPPRASPAKATTPTAAVVPSAPEVQIGTFGAEARITGVLDAATGRPIALNEISQPMHVMTLAARGPGRPQSESVKLQLVMHGAEEAEQTLVLDAPASTIIAHAFMVPVAGDGRTGLRPGRYTIEVRIIGGDGRVLASSLPRYVELNGRW